MRIHAADCCCSCLPASLNSWFVVHKACLPSCGLCLHVIRSTLFDVADANCSPSLIILILLFCMDRPQMPSGLSDCQNCHACTGTWTQETVAGICWVLWTGERLHSRDEEQLPWDLLPSLLLSECQSYLLRFAPLCWFCYIPHPPLVYVFISPCLPHSLPLLVVQSFCPLLLHKLGSVRICCKMWPFLPIQEMADEMTGEIQQVILMTAADLQVFRMIPLMLDIMFSGYQVQL